MILECSNLILSCKLGRGREVKIDKEEEGKEGLIKKMKGKTDEEWKKAKRKKS